MNSNGPTSSRNTFLKTDFQSKIASEIILQFSDKNYRLMGKRIRIGRAADNDIAVDHPSISRYHAMISLQPEGYLIEDLKSRNGVRVNGSLVHRILLSDEDHIQIGDVSGKFLSKQKSDVKNLRAAAQKKSTLLEGFSEEVSKSVKILGFRWKRAANKRKLIFLSMLLFPVFVFVLLFSKKGALDQSLGLETLEASMAPPLSYEIVSREDFAECLEQEDLLNLKKARSCFEALPQNEMVRTAWLRVVRHQEELTKRRYQEGEMAFKSYYFDTAIQKWQEVVLIADEGSEYLSKARLGMVTAEQRRLLR
jgi:hypothetical protein